MASSVKIANDVLNMANIGKYQVRKSMSDFLPCLYIAGIVWPVLEEKVILTEDSLR